MNPIDGPRPTPRTPGFRACLLASVAGHAIAIATLDGPRFESAPAPAPLSVVMRAAADPARPPAIAEAPAPPVARPAPVTDSSPQREPTPRPVPAVAPPPVALATAAPVPAPAPVANPAPERPAPAASLATVVTAPAAPERAPERALATAPAEEPTGRRGKPSTLWLADYTQAVSGQVARVRTYPAVARLRGWEGTTIVALQLSPEGALLDARVEQSSGHEVLDRQAIDMVRQAALPPIPNGAAPPDGPVRVRLPVVFALARRE